MTRNPLNNLEHVRVKPLSSEERAITWTKIATKMPATPLASPWSFMSQKVVVMVIAFVVIVGTVGVSNGARPGDALFPVDLAVERVESAIVPSSRSDHARERLQEFQLAFASSDDDAAAGARMQKNSAPQAGTAMFAVMMDTALQEQPELPPETQAAIERTRRELLKISAEATLKGDTETLAEIQATIEEFESYVASL